MKSHLLFIILTLAASLASCTSTQPDEYDSWDEVKYDFPEQDGRVNDFSRTFTKEQEEDLEGQLQRYFEKTGHEIIILSIPRTIPYKDLEDYSYAIAKDWNLQNKADLDKLDGAMIPLCINYERIRIMPGKEAAKIMPIDFRTALFDDAVLPRFRAHKYYAGIKQCVVGLTERWEKGIINSVEEEN